MQFCAVAGKHTAQKGQAALELAACKTLATAPGAGAAKKPKAVPQDSLTLAESKT